MELNKPFWRTVRKDKQQYYSDIQYVKTLKRETDIEETRKIFQKISKLTQIEVPTSNWYAKGRQPTNSISNQFEDLRKENTDILRCRHPRKFRRYSSFTKTKEEVRLDEISIEKYGK